MVDGTDMLFRLEYKNIGEIIQVDIVYIMKDITTVIIHGMVR
jgi:hypothetical protein